MNWIEITAEFPSAPPDWSPVIELFRAAGCPNSMETDVPPAVIGCLADGVGAPSRVTLLARRLRDAGASHIRTKTIADEDWNHAFREHFKPRRVGKRFVIVPTWDTDFKPRDGDLVITLDPGQAFGTGDHPTTRMCLELLEKAGVTGKRVADVGCGTGILSIGAVRLGAAEVAAVDIDEVSVQVSRENAALNQVSFEVGLADGIASLGEGWDVLVSNIISATLILLAPDAARALVTNGKWIASGIINENWPDVLAAAEAAGFALDTKLEDPQWVAAMFHRT
ncbi:MAG TPA: 50S ribosomal protein L11 methyltransferase [Fimbriimonadaceae bacterium]|nr:50S ribosomal protein L11 methyltransferase [Fimbriimonadaceae bacterium]